MRSRVHALIAAVSALTAACGSQCPQGQELCGDVCADITVDRNHCGACGNECSAGQVCDGSGTCAASCGAGLSECGGSCVDTDVDPSNCGGCGTVCDAGQVCDGSGACVLQCAAGLTACGGGCTDTDDDARNCGACGMACDAGETCAGGSCQPSCGGSLLACDGACVDPRTDATHCGASLDCAGANAGTVCGADSACVAGTCLAISACSLPPPSGTPGVSIGTASGVAIEGGGPVTYTVVLDSEPCDNVYVTLTPDAQVTLATSTLVFTPETWDTPQSVEVTAVHDFDVEGDHESVVTHALTTGDARYTALTVGSATISIADRAHVMHASIPLGGTDESDSRTGSVSDDGRYAAFVSSASNLIIGDTNGAADAFLRDLVMGTTTRVSVAADGTQADGETDNVVLSADGSVTAFHSLATNLVSTTITGAGEIYRVSPSLPIAAVTGPCSGCSNELSSAVAISADGSAIAFSTRRRLLSDDPETEYDVYVWNEASGTLTLESTNSSDQNGSFFWGSNSFGPTISATGQFVGFNSAAQNLASPEITIQNFHAYVKDRTSRALSRVSLMDGGTDNCEGSFQSSPSSSPFISADGDVAAFTSACAFTLPAAETGDANGVADVFVRTISAMSTTRVSVSSAGDEADGQSTALGISDDGRYILFASDATNLVAGDDNGATDLFVHDLTTRTTTRVSYSVDYAQLAEGAVSGSISRSGRFVTITTAAPIMASDTNTSLDVYVVQLR